MLQNLRKLLKLRSGCDGSERESTVATQGSMGILTPTKKSRANEPEVATLATTNNGTTCVGTNTNKAIVNVIDIDD